jgi:hypothetical protein
MYRFQEGDKKIINVMVKIEFHTNRTCRYLIQLGACNTRTNKLYLVGGVCIFLDKVKTPVSLLLRFMKLAADHSCVVNIYM